MNNAPPAGRCFTTLAPGQSQAIVHEIPGGLAGEP
jgi:hypothetical protein